MRQFSAQEGLKFAIEYFGQRGLRLQPNDEHGLLLAWEAHVKKETAQEMKKPAPKAQPEKAASSNGYVGFETGQ